MKKREIHLILRIAPLIAFIIWGFNVLDKDLLDVLLIFLGIPLAIMAFIWGIIEY